MATAKGRSATRRPTKSRPKPTAAAKPVPAVVPKGAEAAGAGPPDPKDAPFTTRYYGQSAAGRHGSVVLPTSEDSHPSRWWVNAGLCSTAVKVLVLGYVDKATGEDAETLVYDGDGSGTVKFVQHQGEGLYEHKEVERGT